MYFHLNTRHADKNSASGNNHFHPRTKFSMWTTLLHKQECLLWIYNSVSIHVLLYYTHVLHTLHKQSVTLHLAL